MIDEIKMICPNCCALRAVISVTRDETYVACGKSIVIKNVTVDICTVCGEPIFDERRDQEISERLLRA